MAAGDLDEDGHLDIVSGWTPSAGNGGHAWLGNGDGTFREGVDVAGGLSVAIGDLNGDGVADLAVANGLGGTGSVLLNTTAMNAMTPSFAGKVDFTSGVTPIAIAIADINVDGKRDLAIANRDSTSGVAILLNTTAASSTTPTFATTANFATGAGPEGIAVADFNADARPDLAIPNLSDMTVSILLAD